MANDKIIELTQQELEDIKDTIKFRECVLLKLNQLKGIPDKVNSLRTQSAFQWALLLVIISSIIGVAVKVLAR